MYDKEHVRGWCKKMEKKKKKNALGWWQKLNAGDPEKNIESKKYKFIRIL